jgi:hypothetical protein
MSRDCDKLPESWGTYQDSDTVRRLAFRRLTPAQRLQWLVEMLEIAYRTGALKPPGQGSYVSERKQSECDLGQQ